MNIRRPTSHRAHRQHLTLLVSVTLAAVLAACGASTESTGDAIGEAHDAAIDWFEGDVDSAFAHAESVGKPLFLYWGAEWCPPCHYLKKKIFTRPEFISRMKEFVPVYLDGDTARAQILGEKLEVQGYPTVIIFDSLGQEVMRMPSTVPVEQYQDVLEAAMTNMRPVKTVLDEVLASGPAQASATDLNLLAFYSWGQDSRVDLSIEGQVEAFGRLYREISPELELERSSFLGLYLVALARQAGAIEAADSGLADEEIEAIQQHIEAILASPALRNANLLWIVFYSEDIVDLLRPTESPERHQLLGAWQRAADAMEVDTSLSVDDRLSATLLKIDLVKLSAHPDATDVEIPTALQEHVRAQAAWAIETVTDESELQTVVNTLAYMLKDAGLTDEAESLLLSKMDDTAAPYYFMSWIAGLKEDAGATEEALEWYRKAYDASEGRYSRFRWGSSYLRKMMNLAPERSEQIETETIEVLTELLTFDDAFAGGNHSRLDGLEAALWTWNEEGRHQPALQRIRDLVHAACDRYPDQGDDSQARRCRAFLVPEVEGDAAM